MVVWHFPCTLLWHYFVPLLSCHSDQVWNTHDVFIFVFGGIRDSFLFLRYSSSMIEIFLRDFEPFDESVVLWWSFGHDFRRMNFVPSSLCIISPKMKPMLKWAINFLAIKCFQSETGPYRCPCRPLRQSTNKTMNLLNNQISILFWCTGKPQTKQNIKQLKANSHI